MKREEMFGTHVFPVTETIWCIRRPSYQNCSYLVLTKQGPVLIDAGMSSDGYDVDVALKKLNLAPDSVRAILLTHWHNDHAAGAAAVQKRSNIPVYCHALDAPNLTRQTAHPGIRDWLANRIPEWGIFVLAIGLLGETVPNAIASPLLVGDDEIVLDDFRVIATPGHTPGHVSFYYGPEKAFFAGDAMAVIGDRVRFMARPVTPDLETARSSMIRCLSLEIDVLCPGHRRPMTSNVRQQCAAMLQHLNQGGRWPLLG